MLKKAYSLIGYKTRVCIDCNFEGRIEEFCYCTVCVNFVCLDCQNNHEEICISKDAYYTEENN